jgi:cytochrome b6-f complex iron-sulfur subunit
VLALPFSQYPALMNSGGSVLQTVNGYSDPTCGGSGIIVINTGSGYSALSTSCTHACCPVSISGSELHCPCHGQNFDFQGKPTTGNRTSTPLAQLQVCSDSTGVYVMY